MNSISTKGEHEAIMPAGFRPMVSIMQSFEQKISLKKEPDYKLKTALQMAERELMANYPATQAIPVIRRLHGLSGRLKYDGSKKGIAIFVSAIEEKVFYLDITVEDKIIVDESFEIRDLVHSKKLSIRYLVLILNAVSFKIYLCRSSIFTLIKTGKAEGITNPSGSLNAKMMLDDFLHRADEEVSILLKAYSLPVFVMGARESLQQFEHLTKCGQSIAKYLYGSYLKENAALIYQILKPHLPQCKSQPDRVFLQ